MTLREHHDTQALYYANVSSHVSTQLSALLSIASTHFYGSNPAQAITVFDWILSLRPATPPLQQSRLHAEFAVIYGQLGRERDALKAIEVAEQLYPSTPEHDPSFLYAEFTRASLDPMPRSVG